MQNPQKLKIAYKISFNSIATNASSVVKTIKANSTTSLTVRGHLRFIINLISQVKRCLKKFIPLK